MQEERSLKALRGELPVDPALEQDISHREKVLRETLRRELGPGYETSTPAIQRLEKFGSEADAMRYAARHDQMTTAEALSLNRRASNQPGNLTQRWVPNQRVQGTNTYRSPAELLGLAGQGYGRTAQMAGQGSQGLRQNRFAIAQARQAQSGGIGSLIGSGIGAIGTIGAAAMMMSHPDFKENIRPVSDSKLLKLIEKTPVYTWNYKGEARERIGGLTTEMPSEVVTDDKHFVDVVSLLGVHTGAIKALTKEVRSIRKGGLAPLMAVAR